MISETEYKQYTGNEWRGTVVANRKPLKNGNFLATTGTRFVIFKKYSGFHLKRAEPCGSCGLKGFIRKVPPETLRIVEDNRDTETERTEV